MQKKPICRKENLCSALWIHETGPWQWDSAICSADNIGCLSLLETVGGEQEKAGSARWLGADKDGRLWGCLSEKNAAQTTPWYIAARGMSQNLHRTLTQLFLNTHILSRSWLSRLAWFLLSIDLILDRNWSCNITPLLGSFPITGGVL